MLNRISIVIPVYNSAAILPTLIARLETILPQIAAEYEVILVNDGSPDNSWDIIKRLAENRPWLRGILLMRNYGQHNALLAGIRRAQGEVIITMDDDLQHPPEEISKLLSELEKGYDVVYGVPQAETHSWIRNLASRFLKWLIGVMLDIPHIPRSGAFRAFRAQVREAFVDYHSSFVSIDVLLSWGTSRFGFVVVRHDPRPIGKSTYTFRKLVRHTLNMVTGFSTLPLRFASLIGFAFTAFGLLILAYVLIRYLIQGSPVPGFPFLASVISIFAGVQLFVMGIFGEYMARLYFRIMGRPDSVTRQTINMPSSSKQSND